MRFFNKMRYLLAAENRSAKYLRYAIGETLLVVIGILIALQVNNWNLERKHTLVEKEFYEGIKNDLKQDKNYIELIINRNKPKIEAFKLLNDYVTNTENPDKNYIDSLLQKYLFVGQRTFYPISGSFQSAVAGNEINAYKNKEVTHSLIILYNSIYARLIDNGEILDNRWDYLTKIYIHERRINRFAKMDNAQISKIMDDIYYHEVQLQWYQNNLSNTIPEIDEILHQIND